MNPYFTEMLMTNILLVYYAKLYLCTAQHSLISTEQSSLQRKAIHAIFAILQNIDCNVVGGQCNVHHKALVCTLL